MLRGYVGIGHERGKYIGVDEAPEYAAEQCGINLTNKTTDEFLNMFVEWYFSGSWVCDDDN